jgi:hypothetical protein
MASDSIYVSYTTAEGLETKRRDFFKSQKTPLNHQSRQQLSDRHVNRVLTMQAKYVYRPYKVIVKI